MIFISNFRACRAHFAFFGCCFLVRPHRSSDMLPHLSFDQRILLLSYLSWFCFSWLGIFRGMHSSNVDLECRHWLCDQMPSHFTNIPGSIAICSNVFSKAFIFTIEGLFFWIFVLVWFFCFPVRLCGFCGFCGFGIPGFSKVCLPGSLVSYFFRKLLLWFLGSTLSCQRRIKTSMGTDKTAWYNMIMFFKNGLRSNPTIIHF